eukprot:9489409-Alexandrium_andersonii.AAC.1
MCIRDRNPRSATCRWRPTAGSPSCPGGCPGAWSGACRAPHWSGCRWPCCFSSGRPRWRPGAGRCASPVG